MDWDEWQAATDAITKPSGSLVVVCFAQGWCPPAMSTARALDELRRADGAKSVFLLDADQDVAHALECRVFATPAILFFPTALAGSSAAAAAASPVSSLPPALVVRRPGWDDDTKFVGPLAKDRLVELVHLAREVVDRKHTIMVVDY
jgi:hypothetical protein